MMAPIGFLTMFLASLCTPLDARSWCYAGDKCGPRTWGSVSRACSGLRQSPIDIRTSKVISRPSLRSLRIERPFHKIRAIVENHSHNYKIFPQFPVLLYGGHLPGVYKLLQFHFHFGDGSRLDQGSEHQINHHGYPVEMHLVFGKVSAGSVDEAMGSRRGLAVIAIFFKVTSTSNPALEPIVKTLPHMRFKGQRRTVALNLDKIIPWKLCPFYRYEGSLTTPPCTENVIWTVIEQPSSMSVSQYKVFVKTLSWDYNTFRPVQALNRRKVTYCKA